MPRAHKAAARRADGLSPGAADAAGSVREVAAGVDDYLWVRGKAIFTAMKKLLFLGACLVALASQPVMAQTGNAEVVVVRLEESLRRVYVSVTRADGKS